MENKGRYQEQAISPELLAKGEEMAEFAALEYLAKTDKSKQCQEKDFNNIYPSQVIEHDMQYVARMEEIFVKQEAEQMREQKDFEKRRRYSEALEHVVASEGTDFGWFSGKNIKGKIVRTSRFDDIANGIDEICEFEFTDTADKKPYRLALCVDMTMGMSDQTIAKKLGRNLRKIESGGAKVKYFSSQAENYKGEIKNIVPVVIGLDSNDLQELTSLVCGLRKQEEISGRTKQGEKAHLVENNRCQIIFLEEILAQLKLYTDHLGELQNKGRGVDVGNTINNVKQATEIITQVLADKRDILPPEKHEDVTQKLIQKYCNRERKKINEEVEKFQISLQDGLAWLFGQLSRHCKTIKTIAPLRALLF